MDGQVVLGVDIGSSSCKTVAVDGEGHIVASSTVRYPTHHPQPGWTEQNADDWYESAIIGISDCVGQLETTRVAGIAIDGPAHNFAVLDDEGDVLAPVIHWSDLRSIPQASKLQAEAGEEIFELSWQAVNPSWTLAQLAWIREERPDVWMRARRFLVTKDYVRYRFTGEFLTDPYDAVGTQLVDTARGKWSSELCSLVGLKPEMFPEIRSPTAGAGSLLASVAAATGITQGTPVFTGSGDTVTEALGVGVINSGDSLIKLGTSGTVLVANARPVPDRRLMTYPHVLPGMWISLAATNSAAATMGWFAETFLADTDSDMMSVIDLAKQAAPTADGLIFHPYLKGERSPYWDPRLRGAFSGLAAHHRLPHFARAVLEGVAFSLRDCSRALHDQIPSLATPRLIGGGSRSDLWSQVVADVLARPIVRIDVAGPAYGSALLAGLGLGWFHWHRLPELAEDYFATFHPDPDLRARYADMYQRYLALAPSLTSGPSAAEATLHDT